MHTITWTYLNANRMRVRKNKMFVGLNICCYTSCDCHDYWIQGYLPIYTATPIERKFKRVHNANRLRSDGIVENDEVVPNLYLTCQTDSSVCCDSAYQRISRPEVSFQYRLCTCMHWSLLFETILDYVESLVCWLQSLIIVHIMWLGLFRTLNIGPAALFEGPQC